MARRGVRRIGCAAAASVVGIYAILLGYFVVVVYPMVWMLYTSLKRDDKIFSHPFRLPDPAELQWVNYETAWYVGKFGQYFGNSVLVTALTVALVLLLSSMAAYALARFAFPGARPLLFYFLAGLMLPVQMAIVPLFFQMKSLHLLGTLHGLLIAYVASGMPFAVFVLTGFFRSLPASLHESAVLDGANEFQAFWHVMRPLAKPGLITVAIFSFLGTWNEFFMAFIFLSGEGATRFRTLPLGLANIAIVSQYRVDWGMAFAGLVMAMLPALLVYSLLQKQLTKGITLGALKG
jgi:ABC-type glycerol-3-phosphate transport system permease component